MKLLIVALSLVCVFHLVVSCQWPMCRYQTMLKASDLTTGEASRFNTADMTPLYLNKEFDPDNYQYQGGWPLYRFVMMQRRGK
ncbi:hypothetical protein L596_012852 [Steinernema carpocapsae]|uniref:Uncharacterized protein n=1 Tax=Steinernema carpocapsae TaxID=34508 RepID=A0A4U5NZA4_STECR|nr:hypothetical protein L596_012852 [Steinernema carpocapsae]